MSRKVAIVLFNLGGPDSQKAVGPFLQNLFSDPAILRVPGPVRFFLARLIAWLRAPVVRKNYESMGVEGGGSPLLPETRAQARALEAALTARQPRDTYKSFIAFRYWHPFTEEAAAAVKAWQPDEVVLLPLYPQFSTTTTGSSLTAWQAAYDGPSHTICCYPFVDEFITAHAERVMEAWRAAGEPDDVTLLMSAHGLPESVVRDGDPYQWQMEEMAARLADRLPDNWEKQVCYQSRVGPLKWIGPSTEDEVVRAAESGRHILIAPIAFVSEHIETLVELGEEYRELAEKHDAVGYTTVAALGTLPRFIDVLAQEVLAALADKEAIRSCAGGRLCPSDFSGCPNRRAIHVEAQARAAE